MARKVPSAKARLVELEEEVACFKELARVALGSSSCPACSEPVPSEGADVKAAVAAESKAAEARAKLAGLRSEIEAAGVRDPVKRLEILRARASADGSWIAAAQLGKAVDEAAAKQEAERRRKAEEARRDPARLVDKIQRALRALPDALREDVLRPFGRR